MSSIPHHLLDALRQVPENGKAEIIDGRVVVMSPTGALPGLAGGEIYVALREHARRTLNYMGGIDAVMERAQADYDAGELGRERNGQRGCAR